MEYRIGLAQVAPRLGEVDANLELAAASLAVAQREGAQLTVFPELALTGYLLQDLVPEVAMSADDPRLLAIGREAPEMLVAIGFVEETDDHRYANSVALLRGGELIGLHRKVYLPTYGLFDEGRFTRPGDRVRTVEAGEPIGRIGLSVCEDFWHASLPMIQALDGAQLLVNVAAGPSRAPGSAAGLVAIGGWHKMQETYALLGTVPIAFCNRVGNEEGLTFWGGSRVLGPDGSVIVEAPLWDEAFVVGTIETDDLRMQRYGLPLLADERLELTRREFDRIIARARRAGGARGLVSESELPPLPAIEPAQAVEVIVGFIRAQLEQTGFERIVLGLSGGVDSATVAYLCARAVPPRTCSRCACRTGPAPMPRRPMPCAWWRPSAAGRSAWTSRRWSSRCSSSSARPRPTPAVTSSTCGAGMSWPASG